MTPPPSPQKCKNKKKKKMGCFKRGRFRFWVVAGGGGGYDFYVLPFNSMFEKSRLVLDIFYEFANFPEILTSGLHRQ